MRGTVSHTDVVTLIEMGDGATVNPEIYFEPMTWALHNKVVDLADEPLRPWGDGNYIPALKQAFKTFKSVELNTNCALFLFFLSDGRPSDGFGKFGGNDAANEKIIDLVRKISA